VRVELYVQDFFNESSQKDFEILPGDDYQISAEVWDNWFQRWLEILHVDVPLAPAYEIGLRLTNDAEIQALNYQYRHQNKPTDVLAFAELEVDCPRNEEMLASVPLYLGDIVISIDTAKRQAQQQEHPLTTELAWLSAHGLLHLLGWDHPDEESLMRMLEQQVVLLKAISIAIDIE
jgi:probable rRNA maturation factor